MKPMQSALARTPLYHLQVAHGARFVEKDGWLLADLYASVEEESAAARKGLALVDVSAFAKFSLLGSSVVPCCRSLVGEQPAPPALGAMRFDAGGPALCCRLTPDHVLFLAETSNRIGLEEKLKHLLAGPENTLIDVTSAHAGFCLSGPGLEQVLAQWTALDLSESALPPASCAETNLAEVHALLVRPPERGRLYIYVSWDLGEHVWMRLVESRAPRGIQVIGMATWLALHEQTN